MKWINTLAAALALAPCVLAQAEPRACTSHDVVFDVRLRTTPAGGERIVVGDLFQNGYDDIVTIDDDVIRGLRSIGDGRFAEFVISDDLGLGDAHRVWLGDVDGDGWLDLLTLSSEPQHELWKELAIMLADQKGGFSEPLLFDLPGPSKALAVLDIQLDGTPDIAVVVGGLMYFYYLDENNDLASPGFTFIETSGLIDRLEVADVNSDGADDLIATYPSSIGVHLVSAGTEPSFFRAAGANEGIRDLLIEDMNGDGVLDLVIGTRPGSFRPVYILHGLGDGTFTFALYQIDRDFIGSRLSGGDFNADGRGDLVLRDGPYALVSRGEREFEQILLMHQTAGDLLTVGDFNGDSRPDIVGTYYEESSFDQMVYTAISGCACGSDLDGNGATDTTDLAIMLAAWGGGGVDLDGDGATGSADIALLLAAWGECP